MAKVAKPAAQGVANADAAEATGTPPRMGRKKLIIIIAAVILLLGGGAAAFLLLTPPPNESLLAEKKASAERAEEEARAKAPPKFVELGAFTANLMREEGDRYLQVAISLKINRPELEDKIKANSPEILHRVNMLLQSKRPSDLADFEGKERLARQIKGQVEYVLGLRKTAPAINSDQTEDVPDEKGASKGGISDVLFTSFIIQ